MHAHAMKQYEADLKQYDSVTAFHYGDIPKNEWTKVTHTPVAEVTMRMPNMR